MRAVRLLRRRSYRRHREGCRDRQARQCERRESTMPSRPSSAPPSPTVSSHTASSRATASVTEAVGPTGTSAPAGEEASVRAPFPRRLQSSTAITQVDGKWQMPPVKALRSHEFQLPLWGRQERRVETFFAFCVPAEQGLCSESHAERAQPLVSANVPSLARSNDTVVSSLFRCASCHGRLPSRITVVLLSSYER